MYFLPLSVDNSRTKLENDEKYDQVTIKYFKEKILNDVKKQFSTEQSRE